jgi:D-alanyl-D-alanine dipeptidase
MSDEHSDHPAEDQDELDAVPIEDNGEALVDFLALSETLCPGDKLVFAPRHPVFEVPRVHLARASVARMICEAANSLPDGLRLQIVEGYRPFSTQRMMFQHAIEEAKKRFPNADEATILREAGRYSAPPDAKTPPPHLTGGAVDLEIVDENGERLDFSSPFEITDVKGAAMNARGISETARRNRERSILEPTGLTNYADEWWHWSFGDNGWALRVGAPHAIYDKIELPEDAHWVGLADDSNSRGDAAQRLL